MVEDAISGPEFAPFQLWLLPACLPASSVGWAFCSWLDLLWHLFSSLFCEQVQQCLRLGFFVKKFSLSLSLSFSLSLSLAIPQFVLLSHVSSLRLPSGQSGLVLTLSNAARASLFIPLLLVADASVWAIFPLGIAVRHVICGFYLFIY